MKAPTADYPLLQVTEHLSGPAGAIFIRGGVLIWRISILAADREVLLQYSYFASQGILCLEVVNFICMVQRGLKR